MLGSQQLTPLLAHHRTKEIIPKANRDSDCFPVDSALKTRFFAGNRQKST
jgi:hypothetical protein